MANDHLTDQQLQDYLDGVVAPQHLSSLEGHLRHCHLCQAELRNYRLLYDELGASLPVELAPGFSARVMKLIRIQKKKALFARIWEVLWPVGCLAGAIAMMSRYVDLKSIATVFIESLNPARYFDSTVITNLKVILLERYNIRVDLIVFAGLTLIVIFLIDQFISKHQSKNFSHLNILPLF